MRLRASPPRLHLGALFCVISVMHKRGRIHIQLASNQLLEVLLHHGDTRGYLEF